MTTPNVQKEIEKEYDKLKCRKFDRCQIYANLIALKLHYNLPKFRKPLYVDVKLWIELVLQDSRLDDFGYDEIPEGQITAVIDSFPLQQRLSLYIYLNSQLNGSGLKNNAYSPTIKNLRRKILWENKKIGSWIFACIGSNITFLFVSAVILIVIVALLLLPAGPHWSPLFEAHLKEFSSLPFLNCLCNAFAVLMGLDTDTPIVEPVNFGGLLIYGLGKLAFIILVANFLYQKVVDIIESKISE